MKKSAKITVKQIIASAKKSIELAKFAFAHADAAGKAMVNDDAVINEAKAIMLRYVKASGKKDPQVTEWLKKEKKLDAEAAVAFRQVQKMKKKLMVNQK